ncbi:MAG: DUF1177 domain-containing protein [Propioniciclava sp.]|uniref:DUF1177 domain-containing protein n=1 Tax=Propioniciclava sp. TaxID=2038686 RepID=UPI0039E46D3F
MLSQVLAIHDLLDDPAVDGATVVDHLRGLAPQLDARFEVERVAGDRGHTDFVRVLIPGMRGRDAGGDARTLGVVGRLGGIGARPERIGYVSDGDGACTALAVAAKLIDMARRGDRLPGDVIVSTHICPGAPTRPHEPVPFMDSPISMDTANAHEVLPAMEAILSVDTTKGNKVINHRGMAISNTARQGYLLPVAPDLIAVYETVCGIPAQVFPLSTQDITPYSNGLYHLNSILQPACATDAPVVGVALVAQTAVAGSATGASREVDIEEAARFCIEVAKAFGEGWLQFFDAAEWDELQRRYGSLAVLQTPGVGGPAEEN